MLKREEDIKFICRYIAILKYYIEGCDATNLYDVNHIMEDFCAELLNTTFGLALYNLNIIKNNFPAVDLADDEHRICIQITSDNDSSKIIESIKKYKEHKLYTKYEKLYVLILGSKKNYRSEALVDSSIDFSPANIFDLSDYIKRIYYLNSETIHSIRRLLEQELIHPVEKVDWDEFDRKLNTIKKMKSHQEEEISLEVEVLFSENIKRLYETVVGLILSKREKEECLNYYIENLKAIISAEDWADFVMIISQADQYGCYEPVYSFCDDYIIKVAVPYDRSKELFINYREVCLEIEALQKNIESTRNTCISMMKEELYQ